MEVGLLLRGIILGFSIAAPVGPIGILCIRRTLTDGRVMGFASGLGAATADAMYGCIAAFGLTALSGLLLEYGTAIRLLGGVYLCYLGLKIYRRPSTGRTTSVASRGILGAYASTLALTLTNPATMLAFTAIFASFGIDAVQQYGGTRILVLGVFAGSTLWWLLLSAGVGALRSRLTEELLVWINRLAAGAIATFGVLALLSPG